MSTLPTAQFGKNGPLVPRLGFGLMGLSAFSGETLPDSERLKVLDRAYEIGAKFWDSAEAYVRIYSSPLPCTFSDTMNRATTKTLSANGSRKPASVQKSS